MGNGFHSCHLCKDVTFGFPPYQDHCKYFEVVSMMWAFETKIPNNLDLQVIATSLKKDFYNPVFLLLSYRVDRLKIQVIC